MNKRLLKKKRRSLQPKLTLPVLYAVAVTFIILLMTSIIYYKSTYQEREISNQRKQIDKAVYAISTIQSTVENISRQIAVSEVVQESIQYPEKVSAEYLVAADNIQNVLRTYTFIMDYIKEILIYTTDGSTYSSFLARDRFELDKEEWYKDFKQTGEGKGYTEVHEMTTSQNGRTQEVISYVMTYYALSDYRQELGDMIISLDYASVEKIAMLDMSLLNGYAIYDKHGECIIGDGEMGLSYADIKGAGVEQFKDEKGNIYLISKDLEDGWVMAAEISGRLLQRQVLFVEIMLAFAFFMLAFLIIFALSRNIRKVVEPINRLSLAAEQFGKGDFDVSVDVCTGDEVEILANAFNRMVQDVQYYTEMSVEHEKIIRRSQVDQLLLQINPHFIYNTLNSITYMARIEGNKEIEKFVNAFIALLQSTLRVEDKVYISLEEEIKNVENYLILQKYRYMGKFDEEIDCKEELKTYLVPKVILQPIVENAIFHGIAPLEGKGKLIISVSKKQGLLCIIVEDNGIGMSEATIKHMFDYGYVEKGGMRKIGIANVYSRIKEICGEEYGFRIESKEDAGTRVIIELPLIVEKENEEGCNLKKE